MPLPLIPVDTAEQSRERDARAIAAGIASLDLMKSAGAACARMIAEMLADNPGSAVEIFTGPGNNGGDGWIIAAELSRSTVPVRVSEAEPPKTPDAAAAKEIARGRLASRVTGEPAIVVDALLGVSARGRPAGKIADSVTSISGMRSRGATVVSIDLPSGMDASTGEAEGAVTADITFALGSLKRAHLMNRAACGEIVVCDIGLDKYGQGGEGDVTVASRDWVAENLPPVLPDAHKGTRKRLALVAGGRGMAGACILAGRAALRSGIGLLHAVTASENRDAVYNAIPAALLSTHEELLSVPGRVLGKSDAVVIGPGLEPHEASRILEVLGGLSVPVVLDAGALAAFGSDRGLLASFCAGKEVVLTPHPAEMARMMGVATKDILSNRFDIGFQLARETGATVLLKGTPTVVSAASGRRMVSATGTSALATGGSGDLLSGIVGTLVAQTRKGFESAVCGAWVHGRAAEICGPARGITLDDILFAMPAAWKLEGPKFGRPVLARLPRVS